MFNSAAERVMWRVRKRLFSQLSLQEIGFFDCVRTGELMNRLSEVYIQHTLKLLCTDEAGRQSLVVHGHG